MHTQMCTPSFIQIIKFSGNMCPMHTHTQPHACALRHTNTYPTTYTHCTIQCRITLQRRELARAHL